MVAQAIHCHERSAELSWVSALVPTGHQFSGGPEELNRGGECTALACFPFLTQPHTIIVFVVLVGTTWVLFLSSREAFYDMSSKFAPLCGSENFHFLRRHHEPRTQRIEYTKQFWVI